MLKQLFPKAHSHYQSLPLLGSILDKYEDWLFTRHYTRKTRRLYLRMAIRIDQYLQQGGLKDIDALSAEDFQILWEQYHINVTSARSLGGAIRTIATFLNEEGLLKPTTVCSSDPSFPYLDSYEAYLRDVRGLAPGTIHDHLITVSGLMNSVLENNRNLIFSNFEIQLVEEFITKISGQYCRGTIQHVVAHIRSFLRFLVFKKILPSNFNTCIYIMRSYRSKPPVRALPWEIVESFLRSIDHTTFMGLRDYTIFFLITHYGLRPSEIVDMKLENIVWRKKEIQIMQRKTKSALFLPLTDQVGDVLIHYLKERPNHLSFRNLFLRVRAPAGPLKPTAVTESFQHWARLSGLNIPFQGPYCLRHSFAIHLLRQGISIKTIGDLLGHKTMESTNVYLRMSLQDLREVALPLPPKQNTEESGL